MVINYYYTIYSLIYYKGVTITVNNNKKALYLFLISLSFFFNNF